MSSPDITRQRLLPMEPVGDVAAYRAAGGGEGLATALAGPPDAVIDEVTASGLRGRGGAGFPTGKKWASVRADRCPVTYVVGNGAEGEPGTFKDRWLLRRNPYPVLEGLAIAAHAVGAAAAYLAVKTSFAPERAALERALDELRDADLLGSVPIEIVAGPSDYLYGEEKAMLEVIEGRPPLPRILPPYQVGLYARPGSANPTVCNNVETLANVPGILRDGAEEFRRIGSESSPGTMLFTIVGDVARPGVYELPLGTPLRVLVEESGGGLPEGKRLKAIFPGASNAVLGPDALDVALDFDGLRAAGSGLGSGGLILYDEEVCIVAATLLFARFLAAESCMQCPACKQGTRRITDGLERIERGAGTTDDLEDLERRCGSVTGGARCGLPAGAALLVGSVLERFTDELTAHLGTPCPSSRTPALPLLEDYDAETARFAYAGRS